MVEMQAQMAQMATMMMEMQEMATAAKAKAKSRSKAAGSGRTAPKENKKAALTGWEADFPTLSHRYSYDVTFNILGSITEQALTFKWKLLLLMLRMKQSANAYGCQHKKKAWRPRKKCEMALVFWHPDGRPCWRRMENQLKKTMPSL